MGIRLSQDQYLNLSVERGTHPPCSEPLVTNKLNQSLETFDLTFAANVPTSCQTGRTLTTSEMLLGVVGGTGDDGEEEMGLGKQGKGKVRKNAREKLDPKKYEKARENLIKRSRTIPDDQVYIISGEFPTATEVKEECYLGMKPMSILCFDVDRHLPVEGRSKRQLVVVKMSDIISCPPEVRQPYPLSAWFRTELTHFNVRVGGNKRYYLKVFGRFYEGSDEGFIKQTVDTLWARIQSIKKRKHDELSYLDLVGQFQEGFYPWYQTKPHDELSEFSEGAYERARANYFGSSGASSSLTSMSTYLPVKEAANGTSDTGKQQQQGGGKQQQGSPQQSTGAAGAGGSGGRAAGGSGGGAAGGAGGGQDPNQWSKSLPADKIYVASNTSKSIRSVTGSKAEQARLLLEEEDKRLQRQRKEAKIQAEKLRAEAKKQAQQTAEGQAAAAAAAAIHAGNEEPPAEPPDANVALSTSGIEASLVSPVRTNQPSIPMPPGEKTPSPVQVRPGTTGYGFAFTQAATVTPQPPIPPAPPAATEKTPAATPQPPPATTPQPPIPPAPPAATPQPPPATTPQPTKSPTSHARSPSETPASVATNPLPPQKSAVIH